MIVMIFADLIITDHNHPNNLCSISRSFFLNTVLFLILLTSCSSPTTKIQDIIHTKDTSQQTIDTTRSLPKSTCEEEDIFIKNNLINIQSLDSTILVSLQYSDTSNFVHSDVYGCIANAYLQKEVAEKLVIAQQELKKTKPTYSLVVYDAARPVHIQQRMWDSLKIPIAEKTKYLSNPKNGSLHNYGAAVDVSIVDSLGHELDMGTPFDFFGDKSQPIKEPELLENGAITLKQVQNRQLLRTVMYKAGFFNIQTEWWHFNACNRYTAQTKYKLIL